MQGLDITFGTAMSPTAVSISATSQAVQVSNARRVMILVFITQARGLCPQTHIDFPPWPGPVHHFYASGSLLSTWQE
jgi:hypothetical protein